MSRALMSVLWPSFLAAGIGCGLTFTLLDPGTMMVLGKPLAMSNTAVYTLGFLTLWALATMSSGLTWFLMATQEKH